MGILTLSVHKHVCRHGHERCTSLVACGPSMRHGWHRKGVVRALLPALAAWLMLFLHLANGARGRHCHNVPHVPGYMCDCDSRFGHDDLGGWHLSCYNAQANEPQQAFVIEYAINDIIRVQCDTAAPYQTAFFQNFSVSEVERFSFSYCTMPNGSFAQVLEGLDVTSLQLVSCQIGDTLDARLFEGLDKLKRLTVTGSKDLRFIPEDTFANLTTLLNLELNNNALESLPEKVFWPLKNITSIQLGSNLLQSLHSSQFRGLDKLISIYLYKNNLTKLPQGIFTNLTSVKNLDLLLNRLTNITDRDLADLTGIENLKLGGNPFTTLPDTLFKNNRLLGDLNLSVLNKLGSPPERLLTGLSSGNPWICDCSTFPFKVWLRGHVYMIKDYLDIACGEKISLNDTLALSYINEIPDSVFCPTDYSAQKKQLAAVSVICVLLAVLLVVVLILYYRNRQTIIAYVYIHFYNVFVCVFSEEDLDEDKTYDAFVSYSSADRDIAMALLNSLESNEEKFKLCIHERDWLPGYNISWNIVNSVQNSRRTILVVSKDFLESLWFQVEFHTAYYQMLEDRVDRLIVIVRGELPPKETLDKELKFLLTTKTYLIWGERWFWEKLKYAMPHRKQVPPTNKLAMRNRPNTAMVKTVEDQIANLTAGQKQEKAREKVDEPEEPPVRIENNNQDQTSVVAPPRKTLRGLGTLEPKVQPV
ncbi:hypothetical protein HPB52_009552 [Rhipicephalus sanguineus]|uniref:TIR domain-containing protein n=1 Tax=Rhipicephalus sanguineus TaxID=34632 RepID=A0A9D4Q5V0_RHISA|nr:hypothetical protein HPB52_009552 [Rhipicephalus sanguineus]